MLATTRQAFIEDVLSININNKPIRQVTLLKRLVFVLKKYYYCYWYYYYYHYYYNSNDDDDDVKSDSCNDIGYDNVDSNGYMYIVIFVYQ